MKTVLTILVGMIMAASVAMAGYCIYLYFTVQRDPSMIAGAAVMIVLALIGIPVLHVIWRTPK